VPTHIAIKDAHILEHHLDHMTVNQISRFVDFTANTDQGPRLATGWEEMFKRYCQEKIRKKSFHNMNNLFIFEGGCLALLQHTCEEV